LEWAHAPRLRKPYFKATVVNHGIAKISNDLRICDASKHVFLKDHLHGNMSKVGRAQHCCSCFELHSQQKLVITRKPSVPGWPLHLFLTILPFCRRIFRRRRRLVEHQLLYTENQQPTL